MEQDERLFYIESEAALSIIEAPEGAPEIELRELLALRGIDSLLSSFGFDQDRKVMLFSALPPLQRDIRHQLSDAYRRDRAGIEAVLRSDAAPSAAYRTGFAALEKRDQGLHEVANLLRQGEQDGVLHRSVDELVFSYTHMFLNRLLYLGKDDRERACYEFIRRFHESALACRRQFAAVA